MHGCQFATLESELAFESDVSQEVIDFEWFMRRAFKTAAILLQVRECTKESSRLWKIHSAATSNQSCITYEDALICSPEVLHKKQAQ